jgi:protein SCO1/2
MRALRANAIAVALAAVSASAVAAGTDLRPSNRSEAIALSQAAVGRPLGGHTLRDTSRRRVDLADLDGRPLVINLVYTACSQACPLIVQNLYPAVEAAQEALGEDAFTVATIGFDSRNDTPERMRAFARSQGVDLPNWLFLSADQPTVDRLAADLGFAITPSAQGFDHLAQVSVIDPEGRVYRQIYGGAFEAPALVEPLKELVYGTRSGWTTVDGLINRVRLFCTLYDPRSGRYRFDWSGFIGIAIGVLSLSGVALFVLREWRRTGHRRSGA